MKMQKKNELCGVARAFVQISENGPRSKKFGRPCSMWIDLKPNLKTRTNQNAFNEKKINWTWPVIRLWMPQPNSVDFIPFYSATHSFVLVLNVSFLFVSLFSTHPLMCSVKYRDGVGTSDLVSKSIQPLVLTGFRDWD